MPSRHVKRHRLAEQAYSCCWCGHFLAFEQATWEHIVPKSRGGRDNLANLALAHQVCNLERGDRMDVEPCPRSCFDHVRRKLKKWNDGERRRLAAAQVKVENSSAAFMVSTRMAREICDLLQTPFTPDDAGRFAIGSTRFHIVDEL